MPCEYMPSTVLSVCIRANVFACSFEKPYLVNKDANTERISCEEIVVCFKTVYLNSTVKIRKMIRLMN
ncbi:hypothetical protein MARI151_30200 [Maribacter litoralis]|uniref:Uncharacterized protein n=1 Tax=Maribacter litoralis TaxID=2059726 RepID=A0A653S3K8_9FLAO|nr:hypothetical protein MARI151_30200 [Maribacter litoralis]